MNWTNAEVSEGLQFAFAAGIVLGLIGGITIALLVA